MAMMLDEYLVDHLMRELMSKSRSPSAFLVYLQLYRVTHGAGQEAASASHFSLAQSTGLSKRSVQNAIAHLIERRFIQQRRTSPTAVPVYRVLTPWLRKRANA